MKHVRLLTVLGCGMAIGSCKAFDGQAVYCTDIAIPGLAVSVRDSATGAFIAAGAKVIARSGTYVDSASAPAGRTDLDTQTFYLAFEHAGSYTLTVSKVGYADWMKAGVVVMADQCHVSTTRLTVLLQPTA